MSKSQRHSRSRGNGNPGARDLDGLSIDRYTMTSFRRASGLLHDYDITDAETLLATPGTKLNLIVGPRVASALRKACQRGITEITDVVFPPKPTHLDGQRLCPNCGKYQPEESFMNPTTGVVGSSCERCRIAAITEARKHYQIPDTDPSHQNGEVIVVQQGIPKEEVDAVVKLLEATVAAKREAMAAMPHVKTCTWCSVPKPLDAFWADYRSTDGRRKECKACSIRRRDELAKRRKEEPVSISIPRGEGRIPTPISSFRSPPPPPASSAPTRPSKDDVVAAAYLIVESDTKIRLVEERVEAARLALALVTAERDEAVAARDQAVRILSSDT